MVIRILDHVSRCYTNDDGNTVFQIIQQAMASNEEKIQLSFDGVDSVPTSFVNSALIPLLTLFPFDAIKQRLTFVDSTRQINRIIRERFAFENNRAK